jgi:cytochrome c
VRSDKIDEHRSWEWPMDTLRLGLSIVPYFVAAYSASGLGAGDAVKGAKAFQACAACHSLQVGRNMTGPSLYGIWGRKAGAAPDFNRYSDPLKRSGVVWNQDNLDRWLTNPAALIPGNNMTFAGIDNRAARADLIAFLHLASEGKAPSTGEPRSGEMMGDRASVFFSDPEEISASIKKKC